LNRLPFSAGANRVLPFGSPRLRLVSANTAEGWFIVTEGPNKGELGELLEDLSGERNYLRFSHRIFIRSTEEND
jgi:hypothetical protein